jgi:hypothetical protein
MGRVGFEPTTSAGFLTPRLSIAALEREVKCSIPPGPIFLCMLHNHRPWVNDDRTESRELSHLLDT